MNLGNGVDAFELDATTVGTSLTLIGDAFVLPRGDYIGPGMRPASAILALEIENTGLVDLNALSFEAQAHPSGAWHVVDTVLTTAHYHLLLAPSATVTTLGAGVAAYVEWRAKPAYAMRIRGSVASGTTTVVIRGTLSYE